MLPRRTIGAIKAQALEYWQAEVRKPYFVSIAKGKEIGHRLADLVDEKTCAVITLNWLTRQQCDQAGAKRSRSMGDVWVESSGIYHPVNVKTGIVGAEGQPNMVSLKKVVNGILQRWIDSYYLLIVKVELSAVIVPTVYMVDLLDCFDFLTSDSGPGQIMLRAARFFREYDERHCPVLSIQEKLERLMKMYEDGERRLRENRARDVLKYKEQVREFLDSGNFAVTPETQGGLRLR